MPSSVIRDFSYDDARNELTVNFRSGKAYVYALVPPSLAASFAAAPALGVFFNERIRDRFAHRKVKGTAPADEAEAAGTSLRAAFKASMEA